MIPIIILFSGSIVFFKLYLINRPVKSFLYLSATFSLFPLGQILKLLDHQIVSFIIYLAGHIINVIGLSRAMTVDSGYWKGWRKEVPWFKRLSLKNIISEIKEIDRIPRKASIKWGGFFILLYFIALGIFMFIPGLRIDTTIIGDKMATILTFGLLAPLSLYSIFMGLCIIYYSRKYLSDIQ